MNKALILLLITCLSFPGFSQTELKKYSISGKINVLVGFESIPAQNRIVKLKGISAISVTDSSGNFTFGNLYAGEYTIEVDEETILDKDTKIIIIDRSVSSLDLLINSDCFVNNDMAVRDIKNGLPRLLLIGGIAPVHYIGQEKFEEKYRVSYEDFGCTAGDLPCVIAYNKQVFAYLDKKYGKKWRKEIRKDVIGLK